LLLILSSCLMLILVAPAHERVALAAVAAAR
jgi:hypothetical protein